MRGRPAPDVLADAEVDADGADEGGEELEGGHGASILWLSALALGSRLSALGSRLLALGSRGSRRVTRRRGGAG